MSQLDLTCQTYDQVHETVIIPWKVNQIRLWTSIFNKPIVKCWNWRKKNQYKKQCLSVVSVFKKKELKIE